MFRIFIMFGRLWKEWPRVRPKGCSRLITVLRRLYYLREFEKVFGITYWFSIPPRKSYVRKFEKRFGKKFPDNCWADAVIDYLLETIASHGTEKDFAKALRAATWVGKFSPRHVDLTQECSWKEYLEKSLEKFRNRYTFSEDRS